MDTSWGTCYLYRPTAKYPCMGRHTQTYGMGVGSCEVPRCKAGDTLDTECCDEIHSARAGCRDCGDYFKADAAPKADAGLGEQVRSALDPYEREQMEQQSAATGVGL